MVMCGRYRKNLTGGCHRGADGRDGARVAAGVLCVRGGQQVPYRYQDPGQENGGGVTVVDFGLGVGVALCVHFGVLGVGVDLACAAADEPPAAGPAAPMLPVPPLFAPCVCPAHEPLGPVKGAAPLRYSPASLPIRLPPAYPEPSPTAPPTPGPPDPLPTEPGLPFQSDHHQHLPLPSTSTPHPTPQPTSSPKPPPPTPKPTPPQPAPPPKPTPPPAPCACPPPARPAPTPAPRPKPVPPKPVPPPAPRMVAPAPKPEITPAEAAPPPDRPDDEPDWGLVSLVALMVPAAIAAAVAAGGAGGGPSGPAAGGKS